MISQTAEYALRAIVFLADQAEPRTTQQIAAATRVPPSYLSKVMQALSRARVVHSQRGLPPVLGGQPVPTQYFTPLSTTGWLSDWSCGT